MAISEEDAERLAALAQALQASPTPRSTAEEIVSFAQSQVNADYASITVIRRGNWLETIAPSNPIAEEIDQLQYTLNEGICRDSTWGGVTLAAQDLATDERWPRWGPKVAALGVASMIAAELITEGDRRIGSVNLYWTAGRRFTRDDLAYAHLFARHAAIALTSALTVQGLNTALDTRKRIGQAQGILMERYNLDEERAFEVLRRYSQDRNVKLRQIADDLVASRRLPEPG